MPVGLASGKLVACGFGWVVLLFVVQRLWTTCPAIATVLSVEVVADV